MNTFITGTIIGFLFGLLAGRWIEQAKNVEDKPKNNVKEEDIDSADWWKNGGSLDD